MDYHNVYVRKWVDYSEKYGLGFLLTNESSGMLFNDSSKICLMPKSEYI
jgi:polo-like kinase 1